MGQGAIAAREHWQRLTPPERERLQTLLRTSGGRPSNLAEAERLELRALLRMLDLGELGKRLAMNAAPIRGPFGRRR